MMRKGSLLQRPTERGVSLIELIVLIVIIAILAGVIGRVLVSSADIYSRVNDEKESLHRARLSLQRLSRDLRLIAAPDSIFKATGTIIRFSTVAGTQIEFSCEDNQLSRNDDLLADGVTGCTFSYYDSNGVALPLPLSSLLAIWTIQVTVSVGTAGSAVTLATTVVPRNF